MELMERTHRLTLWLTIITLGLALTPALLAQNVNQSTTFTVQGQGIANTCYVPTAAQIAANPNCNLDPLGNPAGEWVNLAGTITTAYHFEMDGDGDHEHMRTTEHSELTGIGACSGAKYVEKEDFNSDYKLTLTDTLMFVKSDFQRDDKIKLVSQGPLPNMTAVTRTHVIVDEHGNVTVVKTFPNAQGQTFTKCTK
jgi:hypothetical protein